jgi:O-antigen ligase
MALNSTALNARMRLPVGRVSLVFVIVMTIIVAIFIGLIAVILPWWIIIPFAITPLFIVLVALLPEIALAALLAVLFGIFPESLLPSLPLAGGSIPAHYLGLFVLFAVLILRDAGSLKTKLAPILPYSLPLGAVMLVVIISIIVAITLRTAPVKEVLNEAKAFLAWLVFPICLMAVDTPARFLRFCKALLFVAVILSGAAVFQSLTGIQILSAGRLGRLGTLGNYYDDVIRTGSKGTFLIGASIIAISAAYAMGVLKRPILTIAIMMALLAGIVVEFGRGTWAGIFVGIALIGYFSFGTRYIRLLMLFAISLSIALSSLMIVKPAYLEAAVDRLLSVRTEIETGGSYERRKIENEYALQSLQRHPIFGVGLGGEFKPLGTEFLYWEGETRYLHNSYARAGAKMGVPGLLALVWFVVVMLVRGRQSVRVAPIQMRPLALAGFWTIIVISLVTAFSQPALWESAGISVLALALFFVEASRRGMYISVVKNRTVFPPKVVNRFRGMAPTE